MKKNVILFATHMMNEEVLKRFLLIQKAVDDETDIYILYHKRSGEVVLPIDKVQYYFFTMQSLRKLKYTPIKETLVPGSNHFALLQFYKEFPDYEYYWNIEYDVCFSGDWRYLFNTCASTDADLITSHVERYIEAPRWYWWHTLELKDMIISMNGFCKSFNPIYRVSNRALSVLDSTLAKGNIGHHEAFIPTVLNYFGLTIRDFINIPEGVSQGLYKPACQSESQFYAGSMRFRPQIEESEMTEKNILYHPVKLNLI